RGGFFGSNKKIISQMNSIYYNLLMDTLGNGYIGTEESLFTIALYRYSDLTNYVEIEENGLLWKFFEDLKNDQIVVKSMGKNNIGICGGRQFIAEHFQNSDADYYIFFEDDMMLHENNNTFCKNGFRTYVPYLYDKTLEIMKRENYDFLKLNFTEFYGDNTQQW